MSTYMHGDATLRGEPPSIDRLLSLLPDRPHEMDMDPRYWGPIITRAIGQGLVSTMPSRTAWVMGRLATFVLVTKLQRARTA